MDRVSINEPPRFGLESRGRNKDINTRKHKELLKIKQMVINAKLKKDEEKAKKSEQQQPAAATSTTVPKEKKTKGHATISQPRPTLVFGKDTNESLFPQSQDYDRDDCGNDEAEVFGCKKTSSGFQDTMLLSLNPQESLNIQQAIEESIKDFVLSTADKMIQELEEDFVLCCSDDDSSDSEMATGDLENWELIDEQSSSTFVNLISTPYIRLNSDKEFPRLPMHQASQFNHKINESNPWNRSRHLIAAITQNS
eukprot:gene16649-19781_t